LWVPLYEGVLKRRKPRHLKRSHSPARSESASHSTRFNRPPQRRFRTLPTAGAEYTEEMQSFQIVVCGSIVPDPLQTLEPVAGAAVPSLKNEMMLPAVLDPWAAHALYEAANLAKKSPGSKVWLVALDGPSGGFTDSWETAAALAEAIQGIAGLDRSRLLVFGGWESASRGAGATMQMVGERLGITDQFQGVDELTVEENGSLRVLERVEGGRHQVSACEGPPALLGWATGNLPEPPNNPQVGMANMRAIMPALQRAKPAKIGAEGLSYRSVKVPSQRRETKIVKDLSAEEIALELVGWIRNR
jgi:electron transfer flavoprotein beta subunit